MTAMQGVIRVRQDGPAVTIQVDGWGTMKQCLSLRRFAEKCLTDGATTLKVDLSRCSYMDSTFLGTLLFLKHSVDGKGTNRFALVAPSTPCIELLHQMKFDLIFPVVPAADYSDDSWTELKCVSDDIPSFRRNVVQAHHELADVAGPAGEPFRALVAGLEKEMAEEEKNKTS